MQALNVDSVFFRAGEGEYGPGGLVDYGCAENADRPRYVGIGRLNIVARDRSYSGGGVGEIDEPERGGIRVGVECVYAVVHSGDIEHVVNSRSGNRDAGKIKRLRIHR